MTARRLRRRRSVRKRSRDPASLACTHCIHDEHGGGGMESSCARRGGQATGCTDGGGCGAGAGHDAIEAAPGAVRDDGRRAAGLDGAQCR